MDSEFFSREGPKNILLCKQKFHAGIQKKLFEFARGGLGGIFLVILLGHAEKFEFWREGVDPP